MSSLGEKVRNHGPWVASAIIFSFFVVPVGFLVYVVLNAQHESKAARERNAAQQALILDCVQGDVTKDGPCAPALRARNSQMAGQLANFATQIGKVVGPDVAAAVVEALKPEFASQREIARSELVVKVVKPDGTATVLGSVGNPEGQEVGGEGGQTGQAGQPEPGDRKPGESPGGEPVRRCVLSLDAGTLTVVDVVCVNRRG